MDSTTALVVKVSYGGALRRFSVPIKANGQLDLDMSGLRGKIALLFNLPVDADFSLTYSDEDGDVVDLVDDNDLFDATNQRLKFLKISVQSNTYWNSMGIFHKGIFCDGCGVVPITGPRFKSKVKEDYDLCKLCFSVMGNNGDYTRMDKPISAQNRHPFRGQLFQFPDPWLGPVPQPHHGGSNFRCTLPKLDSRFVRDVNSLDGIVVAPSASFTKIWKVRNNGSLVWPRGTKIVWLGGYRFSNLLSVDLQIPAEGVPIKSELDVKINFVAPALPGRYISYWMMVSSTGIKFGQRVWVLIYVDASLKGFVENEVHGLNLNASPDDRFSREFAAFNQSFY